MTSKNNRTPLLGYIKHCALFQNHQWIQTGVTVQKRSIQVKTGDFFNSVWPWNLTDDLENNMAPLLCYFKFCTSFRTHRSIQNGVTVRHRQIRVKICDFFVPYDLQIWRMALKNNKVPLLCYFKFVHHFIAISQFKLELQSGNAQYRSNLWYFAPCDLEIWQMTLKNNRAPLLCYIKLCASFHRNQSIQPWVIVGKCQIRVNIGDFVFPVTLKFDRWP